MQLPTRNNGRPTLPTSQMPFAEEAPAAERSSRPGKTMRGRGRLMRFMRGYLMLVGGCTTIYVLIKLLVLLFVELGKWLPGPPTL